MILGGPICYVYMPMCTCVCARARACVCLSVCLSHVGEGTHRGQKTVLDLHEQPDMRACNQTWVLCNNSKWYYQLGQLSIPKDIFLYVLDWTNHPVTDMLLEERGECGL